MYGESRELNPLPRQWTDGPGADQHLLAAVGEETEPSLVLPTVGRGPGARAELYLRRVTTSMPSGARAGLLMPTEATSGSV